MPIKKSAFVETGKLICIIIIVIYAAYQMFPGTFWGMLRTFLPIASGLSLIAYVLYRIKLEE